MARDLLRILALRALSPDQAAAEWLRPVEPGARPDAATVAPEGTGETTASGSREAARA